MQKAQDAIKSFTSKSGQHTTSVHESVSPHVQKETVNEHQREERNVVRDREIHQDHHHTTVQPIKDQEILPEQHHHNAVAAEHTTHDHRNPSTIKDSLNTERAQFKHESVRAPEIHQTSTSKPEVVGEHVHHHVHENIQPVVHKQTIEPHVVHTTVPIHETHHNEAKHHTATALPAISMDDYKKHGGTLAGRDTKRSEFEGEPHSLGQTVGNATHTTSVGGGHHVGAGAGTAGTTAGTTGTAGAAASGLHRDGDLTSDGSRRSDGAALDAARHASRTSGTNDLSSDKTHQTTAQAGHKPSLLQKLNPMKDADGDGKKGFMD